ncbi:hypothetical protein [Patulibacter sp. SYSU D01012]|uniref:hypothetical protein n=1 Tax=Patulibacter sp. SYSU D01012 TaxID=2817381 RepID=UPI001B31541B|nr:hypothetical protein [Patulibacter sp. SYSU D01012]
MPYMTVGWTATYSIGHMPQDASYVAETPLTIGWTGKVSTYVLPYDLADLAVTAGEPDPVVVNPPTGPAPAAGVPVVAPPSGTVRPATPPRVALQARVNPALFRRRGVRVRLTLAEPATVEVYATARVRKTLSRRRTKTVTRRITQQRRLSLKPGSYALRLKPSAAGLRTVGARSRLTGSVTIKVRYRDGRRATLKRAVRIARSTKNA